MAIDDITVSSDHLVNPKAPVSIERQAQLHAILRNWSLTTSPASRSAILPQYMSSNCLDISESILPAIHQLSNLTVGRRERAHSLLNTYFQERIRQESYHGQGKNIYATLEVQDVQRAVKSAERMRAGHEMEHSGSSVTVETETVNKDKKRKYDDLEEIVRFNQSCSIEESRPTKLQKPDEGNEIEEISPKTLPLFSFIPSPPRSQSPTPPALQYPKLAPKRTHITLPPITTTHELPEPFPASTPEHFVQAAQRATHEFNVCRTELSRAEKEYVDARQRFEEAVERMEGANAALWGR